MTDSCSARRVAERSRETSESRPCSASRMLSYTDSEGSTLVIWNLMLRPARARSEGAARVMSRSGEADGAGVGHERARDALHERALAGAVGADEPVDLAGLHAQVDARERLELRRTAC